MKSEKYWADRAAQQMWNYMQDAEKTADEVAKLYFNSTRYLQKAIDGIFTKYMTKHGLTEKEAKELIGRLYDKTSIRELLQKLQAAEQTEERKKFLREVEAPAYQARIQRLEALQEQIDLIMQNIYRQEKKISTRRYTGLAEKAYYHSVYNIQKRVGLGFSFVHVDQKQIDKAVNSQWSGRNYSTRIWGNTQKLAEDLKEELLVDLVTGRTEREAADILAKKFAQGASNARRLIRTESCYLSNQIEMQSYKECGIEKYRYLATLDLRTSEICRELDGKVFLVSEAKPGKNCPPMHPWCRSTTVAVVSEEAFQRMQRRARDPVTGKTYLVPASMNYREWYAKYVEGNIEAEAQAKASKNTSSDQKQFEQYREILEDDMPKSFADFQNLKYNEPEKWKFMKLDYQRRHELLERPELKLPNAENAILPEPKFTKYLFDEKSEKGYPKGRAFTNRLGYGAENWQELQEVLKQGAMKYPAQYVDNNGYGDRYVQKMILYGKKGTPANVIVAWLKNTDGTTKLTSAYIKEMK
jgi:SPP1 gp7 family putative phage head morphogenesis protein|nr:MAG TPA: minor capsid protein [Caudoviricetes sp.]